MLTVGLTGNSGSGKSTLAGLLVAAGAVCLDADAIYHGITDSPSPCVDELAAEFGEEIRRSDGALDRHALAHLVFCGGEEQKRRLSRLNGITHRYVKEEFARRMDALRAAGARLAVLDIPLLFEAGMESLCDLVVAITAPYEVRLTRLVARDGLPAEEVERRLRAQPDGDFYRRRADITVENDGSEEVLTHAVGAILARLQ